MKKFIIGFIIGFLVGGTSAYGIVKNKIKDVATKENVEKVGDAAVSFADTIMNVFK